MTATMRQNYEALLVKLGMTEAELRRRSGFMYIYSDDGNKYLPTSEPDMLLVPFLEQLRLERPETFTLTPNDRVALMAYTTSGVADDARRCPATRYGALRALLQQGATVHC